MTTLDDSPDALRPGELDGYTVVEELVETALDAWPDPDARPEPPARLSPSRMEDYAQCPRRFYFQSILRIPTEPTIPAIRGSVVHEVLDRLFDHPRSERTRERAGELVEGAWVRVASDPRRGPESAAVVDTYGHDKLIDEVNALLDNYFTIEDPTRFDPLSTEETLTADIDGHSFLGILDRLDEVAPPGEGPQLWISDYKSGKTPDPQSRFLNEKFNAMRVYAVLVAETRGIAPSRLRLVYLSGQGRRQVFHLDIDDATISNTRARMVALSKAIRRSHRRWDWPARRQKLCDWCDHRDLCDAYGGKLADTPVVVTRRVPMEDKT